MDTPIKLNEYYIKKMQDWKGVNADLIITDPPFGINFNGKNETYNRKKDLVVEGYLEWDIEEYEQRISELIKTIDINLKPNGQALIFSGYTNSHIISSVIKNYNGLFLNGKLYWAYEFAIYSKKRPSNNIYEIFWLVKNPKNWTYNNKCTTIHCNYGEPNLSLLRFKRDYHITKNIIKYPTRLPFNLLKCIIEHFSNENEIVFDPLCGSGMVGIVSEFCLRKFVIGDVNENGKKVYNVLKEKYKEKIKPTLMI